MAADEPPYLTIGTDVSAKYKGAFCEAKIKKVNRVVKCKVTFKNNLGSFVITDDLIKGPLRLGADVEAKHPEKNQFSEAVINKLQDYSQYTVVFDDGDETTLRRTSLCLKSGRHFAESPTLDQFPLTNPEHFGTPVIGSGKFKRKRRSTVNSSLDYESSDDDSLPRKLKAIRGKDPDLGKVVCVDYGDRRKKDNWYPGLIVPLPPQSNIKILKEEHLIRSFKDGKYYQVPKRDIREFTKETGQKVENNALRIAVEKATLYLEKEQLPPHWDKVLFIGLDDEESNDSESDTSDDEPSEEKDRFVAQLYKFMDERGTPINKAPTVSNRDLNLYKLFKIMHKLGGYNKVTNKNKWKTVYSKMGLPHSVTNGPNQVKFAYKRYLQSFEDFYRKLGCTMVNNSRSTRGRHRSDRNIIITRTRDRDAASSSPKSRSGKEPKEKNANEKKSEDKPKAADKKESKSEESPKTDEKTRNAEKKKVEEEKRKKEEKRKLVKKEEETKPEKARTREDARKEKNDSPEKKGTRSTSKIESDKKEKEEIPKDKKAPKEKKEEKQVKEEKPKAKKEEVPVKDRKPVREKKMEEKTSKEKREIPPREKRDLSKEKKDPPKEVVKAKKEEVKTVSEEKSPKRKLERAVKKDTGKPKSDETECKEKEEKKEEKPVVEVKEEQVVKKPKLKREDSPSSGEENAVTLEDISLLEDKKPRLRNESEDEPPNRAKRKFLKGDDKDEKESFHGFSDSDESLTNDSEKPSSNKDLKKEIEVGDRVKVKYGRGRMQKVYEAKVLKIEPDSLEKRYYVHYAGWNMRYDEWVRKNYIVAVICGNKKFETKNPLPPSGMKKQERARLPGVKSVRKNSTSSTNSNVSRSTRSDKREDCDLKKRSSKKYDTSAADTSQDSDSEREDDEEGNDADIEDSSALQTDSCFKEELFSDDEEKEKLEDAKRGDITELEKALEPSEDNYRTCSTSADNNTSQSESQPNIEIKTEIKPVDTVAVPIVEKEATVHQPSVDAQTLSEKKETTLENKQSELSSLPTMIAPDLEAKLLPSSETLLPTPPSEMCGVSLNKSPTSVLSFSGLIKKPESVSSQDSSPAVSESSFLPAFPAINVCKQTTSKEITSDESDFNSLLKSKNSGVGEDHFPPKNIFTPTVKSETHSENVSVSHKINETVEQSEAERTTDTSVSCPELFSRKNSEVKDAFDSLADVKETCDVKSDSGQNVFMPSFSPQNAEQSFIKLGSDNRIQSETVDVSKMIPGILERLKNDVVSEFDSPLPQKNELTFDFLRESSSKCMSRSDSSSSLRICESDTNDSNTDSKDLGFKHSAPPVTESPLASESVSKSTPSIIAEAEAITPVKDSSTESSKKSNESESVVLSSKPSTSETDKSMNSSEQTVSSQDNDFTSVGEQPPNPEDDLKAKDDSLLTPSTTTDSKSIEIAPVLNQAPVIDSDDAKDTLFKDLVQVEKPSPSFAINNTIKCDAENESITTIKKEATDKGEVSSPTNSSISPKETSDSVSAGGLALDNISQKGESPEQNSPSHSDEKNVFDSINTLKNITFSLKKEGKKKKFGKKLGKKFGCSELLEKEDKEMKVKDGKTKTKKKMRFESFACDRARNLEMKSKSKKLKKNKNKKRFKREEACEMYLKKADDEEIKDFDKVKRKEKKKIEKKFFRCGMKNDDGGDGKMDVLKKKKGKKNRDKFLGEKRDVSEKKTKKKRKLHLDNNQDTDSDKDTLPKLEKKRKKKKPKIKDCSSSDDGADKFFKDDTMDLPSTSNTRQEKSDDPDMSFLLCEEKVPASPVDMRVDDTSGSSSLEDGSSELPNVNNTVMDNTPPTTPSSTESLLSSSPTHERDSFPYPESTQSGRESVEGESDLFRCGSNRTISRGSEEYHAATTLAFAVCQSVSEKPPPNEFAKQQKAEIVDHQPSKRKKKNKRFRRMSESTKSPKHKSSYLRMSKVDNCYEDSSGTSLAAISNSPPYGSLNFSRSLPVRLSNASDDIFYIPLHEKDPEKRIALLQKKMTELRKEYMALRAEVFAIDHKRRKARKKVKDAVGSTVNPSVHSDDGQSCS